MNFKTSQAIIKIDSLILSLREIGCTTAPGLQVLPKVQLATRTKKKKKKNGDKEAVVKVHNTKNNDNNYYHVRSYIGVFIFLKHLTSTH